MDSHWPTGTPFPGHLFTIPFLDLFFTSAFELQEPSSSSYSPESKPGLLQRLDKLEADVKKDLKRQGFEGDRVRVERMLNMRFDGTDTALMVLPTDEDSKASGEPEDFVAAFRKSYKSQFGFLLDSKNIIVDDVKVCRMVLRI